MARGTHFTRDCITIVTLCIENKEDLSSYDLIGFASGIACEKYYPQIIAFAEKNLPDGKDVFFIHTAGNPRKNHNSGMRTLRKKRTANA